MKVATVKTRIYLGVFVLCVSALAFLAIIIAGDKITFFRKSQVYSSRFANAAGLVAGAPVRMGGVEVGRVGKIQISASGGEPTIVATLRIDAPHFELLRKDAKVRLDTQGLLGDKFVALSAGTDPEPLDEGQMIETAESDNLAQVVEKSKQIMESVESTTRKIDQFTEGLPEEESMKAIGQDFSDSARALRVLLLRLSDENGMVAALNDPASKRMLQQSLMNLESATGRIDSIARKIDEGQGTLGALVNDRTLYEDIRGLLGKQDRGKIARRVFIEAGGKEEPVADR